MNSNWFKLVMKMTKVEYGKNLLLKGVPIIFNKGGAKLKIGENVTIKSKQVLPYQDAPSEVFIRELLPGIHLAGKLRLAVFPVHPELIID